MLEWRSKDAMHSDGTGYNEFDQPLHSHHVPTKLTADTPTVYTPNPPRNIVTSQPADTLPRQVYLLRGIDVFVFFIHAQVRAYVCHFRYTLSHDMGQ